MDAKTILVKYPTRSRPDLFQHRMRQWSQPTAHHVHFLISVDEDDPSMHHEEWLRTEWKPSTQTYQYIEGKSTCKVEAINRDIEKANVPWDYLIVLSDDFAVAECDWAHEVIWLFEQYQAGVLWFPDGRQDRICTLPCMTAAYYDRYGYIYNPVYKTVFCDNEQTIVAQKDGALAKVDLPIFRHDWVGEHHRDALCVRNESRPQYLADGETFRRRAAKGFPKEAYEI